jgi:hypothetical protein
MPRLWPLALLGSPPLAFWLLVWGLAASLVWLVRLLVESGGAAVAGLLWGSGHLLASIEAFFMPARAGR